MPKKLLFALLAVIGLVSVAACDNTIRGVDRDLEDSGEAIDDSIG